MSDTATARTYLMGRQVAEGLTSKAMAARLGMSQANWCHVRKGRRRLAPIQILRACRIYRELYELLCREEKSA
jgi:hypothetical protein